MRPSGNLPVIFRQSSGLQQSALTNHSDEMKVKLRLTNFHGKHDLRA
jgi:hypothetical protein